MPQVFLLLRQAGFTECCFKPSLDFLILKTLGINSGSGDTLNAYNEIMKRRSKKIEPAHDSILSQTLKAYVELLNIKKMRKVKLNIH